MNSRMSRFAVVTALAAGLLIPVGPLAQLAAPAGTSVEARGASGRSDHGKHDKQGKFRAESSDRKSDRKRKGSGATSQPVAVASPVAAPTPAPTPVSEKPSNGGGHHDGSGTVISVNCVEAGGACAGQAIVRFKPGVDDAAKQAMIASLGGSLVDRIADEDIYLVAVDLDVLAFISAAQGDSTVQWAEQNTIAQQPIGSPKTFFPRAFTSPAAVTADALTSSAALASVRGLEAASCSNGTGATVAVIDTGVDMSHAIFHTALGDTQFIAPFDVFSGGANAQDIGDGIDNDNDGQVDGAVGHGTHVAGIVKQISPNSSIMPIKALNDEGIGQAFLLAKGIDHAIANGADVINLSLGAQEKSQAVTDLLKAASEHGIVIAAAGGNGGRNGARSFPAASDINGLEGVAATTNSGMIADFSSRYEQLDLAAPGVDVISSLPVGAQGITTGWATWSGTSMSTAWVSGTAADIIAAHPDWTVEQVVHQMEDTAGKITGDTGKLDRDSLLNAQAAVCGQR